MHSKASYFTSLFMIILPDHLIFFDFNTIIVIIIIIIIIVIIIIVVVVIICY